MARTGLSWRRMPAAATALSLLAFVVMMVGHNDLNGYPLGIVHSNRGISVDFIMLSPGNIDLSPTTTKRIWCPLKGAFPDRNKASIAQFWFNMGQQAALVSWKRVGLAVNVREPRIEFDRFMTI